MQEGQNARQQVVERIRQSTSILVAVGNNPSVDALAASLGLSLMLNKMNKHATAVFSGQTPAAIQFLEPNKTFETSVDALRDFIISLDKEKADRLRYKVEDDVVRIFITPYKTSISEKDLQFSQGDFNVDLIIALGVEKREDLDKAIVAHGRILHDATVITVNADNQRSTLGSIDYNDAAASSLCEMLVGMSEAFQQPGILDPQISTALLTGIVASTDRFSNPRTSPRVMTMAAQLMAAGANQQLIATNLEKAKEIAAPAPVAAGPMAKQQASAAPAPMQEEPPKPKKEPGELDIVHEKPAEAAKPAPAPAPVEPVAPAPIAEPEITAQQEKELEEALPAPQVQHNLLPDVKEELAGAAEAEKPSGEPAEGPKAPGSGSVNDPAASEKKEDGEGDYISSHGSWKGKRLEPPTLGGTLNATTEEAHDASAKAEEADRNKKLLTHPADAPQQKSRRSRNRKGRGNSDNADVAAPVAAVATAPALPAQPAPSPQSVAAHPPVVAPEIPSMPPQPEAAPFMPTAPEPAPFAPAPAPTPAPLPPAAPELPPASAPAPLPEPVVPAVAPAPVLPPAPVEDLEALHKEVADSAAEAAAVAQPAENAAGELDSARAAVSEAFEAQPFNPAGQPLASVGAQPMPGLPAEPAVAPPAPDSLQSLPPAPVDTTPAPQAAPTPLPPAPEIPSMPPLPPMPPMPDGSVELPPAPDLPGLNAPLPPISEASAAPADTTPPAAPSSDPAQFKIPGA